MRGRDANRSGSDRNFYTLPWQYSIVRAEARWAASRRGGEVQSVGIQGKVGAALFQRPRRRCRARAAAMSVGIEVVEIERVGMRVYDGRYTPVRARCRVPVDIVSAGAPSHLKQNREAIVGELLEHA